MSVILLRGDARRLPLPDESVDLIVTSPPYWGQRDYRDGGQSLADQIGAEATPREYVAALVECTREWARVLKPSGSMFVVLGDKYSQRTATRPSSHQDGLFPERPELHKDWKRDRAAGLARMPYENVINGNGAYVPEKSLMGLPWRYALACTDDLGLILREEIIWGKANGMPESVTDRTRRAHEQVFHFTRQSRYYAAVDEIREPHLMKPQRRPSGRPEDRTPRQGASKQAWSTARRDEVGVDGNPLGKLPGSVWDIPTQPLITPADLEVSHFAAFPMELPRRIILGWSPPGICVECGEGRRPVADRPGLHGGDNNPESRNGTRRRSTMDGGASEWARRTAMPDRITGYVCACTPYTDHDGSNAGTRRRDYNPGPGGTHSQGTYGRHQAGEYERVGPWREYHFGTWTPPPVRPAVVLDPFGGTGTTALVADVLGRTGISADRSADYCRLARWRTTDPGERARALQVPKPPSVPDGQDSLFEVAG